MNFTYVHTYVRTCILQVEKKVFFFFPFKGCCDVIIIPVLSWIVDGLSWFFDDVALVSTWSFLMSFFFFFSFLLSLWYYRQIN